MATVSLWIYRVLAMLALPLAIPVLKIRQLFSGKSRPRFRDRMGRGLPELPTDAIWIQAVSVGEVELARRLVAEIGRKAPNQTIFLTATTATGLDLAKRTLGDELPVFPCPVDLPGPVSRVMDVAAPQLVVLVETELWPELIHQAGRRRIPVAVVNARLSEGSFAGYRRVAGALRKLLAPVRLVLARTEADAGRFAGLGVASENIVIGGNLKYDLEADQRPLSWAEDVRSTTAGRPVVIAGSTMEGEEALVVRAIKDLAVAGPQPFLILAPRHPERFDAVAELLATNGIDFVRRSEEGAVTPTTGAFLIDTIGELGRAYRLATVAFIGGSLVPTGGHNPLEPAVWGVPVLSGTHVHNFQEVYDEMTSAGGARLVADADELRISLAAWLDDPKLAQSAGAAGREVVEQNRGATSRTATALLALIKGA